MMYTVHYQNRTQLKLLVGDKLKSHFDSGCKIFDLNITDVFYFDVITFQNFYTAYLTIKAKDSSGEWKPLLRQYKLMPNCHGELCAQKQFTIKKDMMIYSNLKGVVQLRFILQQPSIYWKDFTIEDIKILVQSSDQTLDHQLEKYSRICEGTKTVSFERLPPIEELANKLQNLWALCYDAKKEVKKINIERFSVDGMYEISALTHN